MADKNPLIGRIATMRRDRGRVSDRINEFYKMGVPERPRVGTRTSRTIQNTAKVDELFDETLQTSVIDFASDQVDYFVPDYKPWVKMKPGRALAAAEQGQFKEGLKRYQDSLFDLIRKTNFYEHQDEIFKDVAGGAAGIVIPQQRATLPVRCIPVLMGSLLFDEGAYDDLDGRAHEFYIPRRNLKVQFPDVDFSKALLGKNNDPNQLIHIIQGCYQRWNTQGMRWVWFVMAENEVVQEKVLPRGAPPPVLVARWRNSPPSAWGPGPADPAMAPARTLDELAYLNLKGLGKEVDPPFSYVNDGEFNPEGGVEPGDFLPRRDGSDAPEPLYQAKNNNNLFFEREKLEMRVKRCLYQDGPFQRGDTPPTATQWLSEEARKERRQARRRIYREYVLPCLQRFAYVFARRGELEPIEIGGEVVDVEFISPMSKASDVDEVSSGVQLAESIVGIFGEAGIASIDAYETAEAWQEKLGDTTVKLKKPSEQPDILNILGGGKNGGTPKL
jgi:hypothetical protein